MATKRDEQAADYRAEAIAIPFAEAAERSVEVSEMGETQSGIRTERVTLECVHRFGKPPREWDWWRLMELRPGESVRVVEDQRESHLDAQRGVIETLTRQRDAAIRERDKLQARVAEMEAHVNDLSRQRGAFVVRIADLESQLESVACRAADAEMELEAASGGNRSETPEGPTQAASGGGDHFADASKMVEQPRGWLTAEERELIGKLRKNAAAIHLLHIERDTNGFAEAVQQSVKTVDNLLARSSPPEVVLPRVYCHGGDGEQLVDIKDVRAAFAAAGVPVKEVGRE